ncbi:MAG: DUF6933 domain-containing protein [Candidatus Sumerlaeia bacterium]
MQLIRCTAKLRKEMGLKPKDLTSEVPEESRLGQWHANLIYIDRRKTLLFVNDRTLFNFIAPAVSRAQISELDKIFRLMLSCTLADEKVPDSTRELILEEYTEIAYAKSSSRIVLGAANDLAYHYETQILHAGGVHSPLAPQIIRKNNRLPFKPLKYLDPINALAAVYGFEPLPHDRSFMEKED